jgi:hypothetical protein
VLIGEGTLKPVPRGDTLSSVKKLHCKISTEPCSPNLKVKIQFLIFVSIVLKIGKWTRKGKEGGLRLSQQEVLRLVENSPGQVKFNKI